MAYTNKTTEQLESELNELTFAIKEAIEEKQELCYHISLLRKRRNHLYGILYARGRSKYGGEFYINSEFRKKYGKTYRELSAGEKREYYKEYKRNQRL